MAQFNADILLAVRGSEKAKREIEKLEASLDKLGKKANLDIGGQIRLKGAQALLRENVKNTAEYNKQLKISQQIAREANKLARVQGNPNQYGGPIGPGQASPSRLSSSLAQRRNELIQQRARGRNQFPLGVPAPAQDPVRDQQRRAKITERNIALRNRVKAIARATAKIEAKRDARLKGQNSLTNGLLKLNKATLNAARSEAQERGESVAKQRELNNELKKTQQYSKAIGPKQAPGAKGGARRGGGGGGAGGGLGAGIGFPLLFGGGPGSIIGGALGSAGGFGTQILASAIGGIIDQAIADVAKLGQAFTKTGLDADALAKAIGDLSGSTKKLIDETKEVSGSQAAAEAAAKLMAATIGDDAVTALTDLGDATNELGSATAILNTEFQALAAQLLGPVAQGVAGLLERTNLINAADRITAGGGEDAARIRAAAERGGENSDDPIQGAIDARLAETAKIIAERRAEARQEITDANIENSKTLEILETEGQILDINKNLLDAKTLELTKGNIKLKYAAKLEEEGLTPLEKKVIEQQELNELRGIDNKVTQQQLAADRKAEAAARKAANEQKRLAREAEQAAKKELRVQQQLAQIGGQFITDALKLIEIQNGKKARLEAELEANILIFKTKAEEIKLSGQDVRIQEARLELLGKQAFTRQEELKAQLEQIKLAERLAEIEGRQNVENTRASLGQELGSLALGLTPELELANEQANRLTNTIKGLDDQLEKLQEQRKPGIENKELETQIANIQNLKLAYQDILPQIAAAEQKQLAYNKALGLVTPGVNSLVSGLQEVVAGTKTAEEAFADFLDTIGKQLIQTAATMIAQYIAIGIARMFAGVPAPGGAGGGGGGLFGIPNQPSPFAAGGFVTSPTKAMIGEGGQPEYVIPANKMDSAMSRYNDGARGESVVGGANSAESTDSLPAEQPSQINISGGVMQVDNTNYIRQDQIPAIVDQASKQGEARALRRLQMSPSSRRKVGI